MSFSYDIKKELSKMNTLANNQLNYAELMGYLLTINATKKIKYSTESEYNINRFTRLLSNLNLDYSIKIIGKIFTVTVKTIIEIDYNNFNTENEKKSVIRGAFLGAGSISNPKTTYHLEIVCFDEKNSEFICTLLGEFNLQAKITKRNKKYIVYIKDGEEISEFLALIGANGQVLKFEEERVLRDMKNNVNRLVNCETANINKTINASVAQIDDIEYIKKRKAFNKMPKQLQEMANIRLSYPDITLVELGKKLSPKISKSGVSHRLKKISEIANNLRKE